MRFEQIVDQISHGDSCFPKTAFANLEKKTASDKESASLDCSDEEVIQCEQLLLAKQKYVTELTSHSVFCL